jgi:hypothetical protein
VINLALMSFITIPVCWRLPTITREGCNALIKKVTMQEMKGVRRDRKRKVIERAEEGTDQYDRGRLWCHGFFSYNFISYVKKTKEKRKELGQPVFRYWNKKREWLFNIEVCLKSVLEGATIASLLCSIFISHIVIQNLFVRDLILWENWTLEF